MLYSNELDWVVRENFSSSDIARIEAAMEAPGPALDVMKGMFDTVFGSFRHCFKKLTEKEKFDKVIEASKGDITKVANLDTTLKVLKLLQKDKSGFVKRNATQILALYNEMVSFKVSFMNGYVKRKTVGGEAVWVSYIVYVRLIIAATCHLLMVQTNQRKENASDIFDRVANAVKYFRDGTMKKWCDFFLNEKKQVQEEAVLVVTAILLGTIITMAFFIRALVFYFYYLRMELSDYFAEQAAYLNLHASEIKKSGTLDKHEEHAVINAQKSWADTFTALSDAIASDDIKAVRKVNDSVKHSNKEVNPDKISIPSTGVDFF